MGEGGLTFTFVMQVLMPSHFLKTTNNLTQFFIIQNNHFGLKLAVTYECALQLRDIIHQCALQLRDIIHQCALQLRDIIHQCALQLRDIIHQCALQLRDIIHRNLCKETQKTC